ncbi:RecQ family ATP-dependent DNA helicase [Salegentibacter sp. F14]
MQQATHILEKYWGHKSFRPKQWPIIEAVLKGKDVIALLPTGGGKSVCFQVPALYREGICIVVSPLIALMQDQVNALKNKGIKAMALTGGISFQDLDTALDNCIYGNYKFLYLSPERLQQELVQQRIKRMNVNLIAVDEAHCISQWGHDFRPAYRNVNLLKVLKPDVPLIGLTATATSKVVQDMISQLDLNEPEVFKQSFLRKNLAYNVLNTESKTRDLIKLLDKREESAIIYVRSRKATLEISDFLKKNNYKAEAFHGGLKFEEKQKKLKDWFANNSNIIVATTAFGMGIDKPDVRQVIHLNLPESIESYFQEAGRAGRDEKPAVATIITHTSDIPVLKKQFLAGIPDVADIKLVYRKLNSYFRIAYGEGENTTHDFNFREFCQHYQLKTIKTYQSLQLLDRCGILKLSEQFQKKTNLQFIVTGNQLQYFLKENPKYDLLAKTILRTYGGILENNTGINLTTISEKTGIQAKDALGLLEELQQQGIADFSHAKHDANITFWMPREDDTTIHPFSSYIKAQKKSKEANIQAVLDYIENDKVCRSRQLLEYFGEKNVDNCGVCSVCTRPQKALTSTEMNEIYRDLMPVLKDKESTINDISHALNYPQAHILKVLGLLVEKGRIYRTKTNAYKIID